MKKGNNLLVGKTVTMPKAQYSCGLSRQQADQKWGANLYLVTPS